MTAETFDRAKPLFRRFEMEDGSRAWFPVNVDNTPGEQVPDWMAQTLEETIDREGYREGFEVAFEKHRKATVYANIIPPVDYEVPEGCNAILRHARIENWGGKKIALGRIYGDRAKRWPDGSSIHTSYIVKGPDADGIVVTRNSTYKLEMRVA